MQNAKYFKRALGSKKLCAVVKSDAYGHGIHRVASVLCDVVDMYAVNCIDEALKIKAFSKEILILLPQEFSDIQCAVDNGFVLTLDSFQTIQQMSKCNGVVRAHLKIDSGMSRLGFRFEQLDQLIKMIDSKKIQIEGIFSHFYGENQNSCDEQLNYFSKCSKIIKERFPNCICHIANTAGVLLGQKYHLDMARVGLGLYGYGNANLMPAKTVTGKVVAIKQAKRGDTASYGATWQCVQDTRLAIVNVGYADGFSRSIKKPVVKIANTICPVVGKICMSMCIVDVGELIVNVGDEVVLWGQGVCSCDEDTSIYQLLCNLH